MTKRPDLKAYFTGRIDFHVNGMMAGHMPSLPREVSKVVGDVDSSIITVTDKDGVEWKWTGGRYSSRKVSGCYAPLMPKPVK